MTPRQLIAYQDPCARAYETIADKFRSFVRIRGRIYSTILTVNK